MWFGCGHISNPLSKSLRTPLKSYKFPAHSYGNCQWHFQSSWLDKYHGLVYSENDDGGNCKFCVLFAQCKPSVSELGVLVRRPLTNLKKTTEKFHNHFLSKQRKSHQDFRNSFSSLCCERKSCIVSSEFQSG